MVSSKPKEVYGHAYVSLFASPTVRSSGVPPTEPVLRKDSAEQPFLLLLYNESLSQDHKTVLPHESEKA
ncbi:unnamed protein product [Nezara viridula]|uniref:Uncharacterized protein n=1 Tax=Nezara viridula TaxID=85310 RepID=A0A9P0HQI4_NEZVI|nr:unnamed protein product [Nezara viridula]